MTGQEFIELVASMETSEEAQERRQSQGQHPQEAYSEIADDSVETIDRLVELARSLV